MLRLHTSQTHCCILIGLLNVSPHKLSVCSNRQQYGHKKQAVSSNLSSILFPFFWLNLCNTKLAANDIITRLSRNQDMAKAGDALAQVQYKPLRQQEEFRKMQEDISLTPVRFYIVFYLDFA